MHTTIWQPSRKVYNELFILRPRFINKLRDEMTVQNKHGLQCRFPVCLESWKAPFFRKNPQLYTHWSHSKWQAMQNVHLNPCQSGHYILDIVEFKIPRLVSALVAFESSRCKRKIFFNWRKNKEGEPWKRNMQINIFEKSYHFNIGICQTCSLKSECH